MKEYLISAVTLGLIAGIALHLAHRELLPAVRTAAGVVLLSFVVLPIGSMLRALPELEIPDFDGSVLAPGGIEAEGEDAFCLGIERAVASRFSVKSQDVSVSCDGFKLEGLSAERVTVVLSGSAARLDYRAVRDYIEESLEVLSCEVRIEG